MAITHPKVSAKADGTDSSLVLPSDWNADHTVAIGGTPAPVLSTTNAAGNATTYLRTNDQLALFDATVPAAVGTAAAGAAAVAARRDHVHPTGAGTPSTQAFGDAAAVGTGPAASMTDHKHAMPAVTVLGGTPAPVLSTSAAAGNATTYLRTNDQIALFDATAPSAATSAGAVGTAAFAARRDHQHPNAVSTTGVRLSDDFFYGTANITTTGTNIGFCQARIIGTASQVTLAPRVATGSHPGLVECNTGSTSLGAVHLLSGSTSIVLGAGRVRYGAWVMVPVLSTSAQRFEIVCGITDNVTAACTDGVFFNYIDTVQSGHWTVSTVSNSTSTSTLQLDTGTTVTATQWYKLEVEVNAAASTASFFIDGASAHADIITNIPSGAGRETGFVCGILKSVGATASLFDIDAHYLEMDFTTPR